jgi:hypothetical protein
MLTLGFCSGMPTKSTRPGGDNGAARWTTIKVYDTSTSVEIMDNGDILLGPKLEIIQESSRKADLSKTERAKGVLIQVGGFGPLDLSLVEFYNRV